MNNIQQHLRRIYARTDGHCHLTGRKLAFKNYGKFGERGAWEIEHSVPQNRGGTDHLNNLYPARISANRSKGDAMTRGVRAQNGLTRAPLCAGRKAIVREENQWAGLALGALVGLPFGAVAVGVFAAVGALIGSEVVVK
jgi:5-methylcytosine-specific restriction endonuclease McrA